MDNGTEDSKKAARFFDGTGRQLLLEEVVEAIHTFVALKPESRYEIIVGTDSRASDNVSFVTAITVRRIGNGAVYFWTRSYKGKFPFLRDRIFEEAISSITLMQELRGRLKDELQDDFFWNDQVHIDIGKNGKTKEYVDGVVGMVKAYGFDPVIKPYAFGAFAVADRHT